jgi:transposase-like protein
MLPERSHIAVWKWVQRFNAEQVYPCKSIAAFIVDETQVQIGRNEAWLWVAAKPVHRVVLGFYISRHRSMLVRESFLRSLVQLYGKHTAYSDGGRWYPLKHVLLWD